MLISDKLAPIYGAVQGGHAIAQWLLDHQTNLTWQNETLVFLSCDIEKMHYLLTGQDISLFYEPDLENQLTAIAVQSSPFVNKITKKLKLLK